MDKYAVVTGADRGLGLELSRELLRKGFNVFAGRYLSELRELDKLKEEHSERLNIVELDISSDENVLKAAEFIAARTGRLDVIINNAAILGGIEATIFDKLDFEEIQKVFNVNSLGPLRVTNALSSLLVKGETKLVINISSEAGSISNCYRNAWFAYCMSKAALNMQSAIIHNSLKEVGGNLLVIHPGHLRTYMRGEVDSSAKMLPVEAAVNIVKILENHEKYRSAERPAYIDFEENKMNW